MNTILYFSPDGVVYETSAYSNADIVGLVHDYGLESLTSTDRQFDFWFTPTTRRCRRTVNRSATEMLWQQRSSPRKPCRFSTAQSWSPRTIPSVILMGSAGNNWTY